MKKFISIILALTLLMLTSCGNGSVTTEQTSEPDGVGISQIQPIFNSIENLLAASRGERKPDNMAQLNSFEFPDFDRVVYPVCNLEGYHLFNAMLWDTGYQYVFKKDELDYITVGIYMNSGDFPKEGESLENGAYRNGNYVFVPYGDVHYNIHFSSSYTGEKTPDVVTMVSVDIP